MTVKRVTKMTFENVSASESAFSAELERCRTAFFAKRLVDSGTTAVLAVWEHVCSEETPNSRAQHGCVWSTEAAAALSVGWRRAWKEETAAWTELDFDLEAFAATRHAYSEKSRAWTVPGLRTETASRHF